MQIPANLVSDYPVREDAAYPTGWSGLTNHRVRSGVSRRRLEAFRESAYAARQMDLSSVAVRDEWDGATCSEVYLLFDEGRPAGTVRVSLNYVAGDWHRTPVCYFFEREVRSLLACERCVDAGRLLTMPGSPLEGKRCVMALFQNVTAAADQHRCRFLLAPTRADHTRFYFGMGFVAITEPRVFLNWPEPVVLLAPDWRKHRSGLRQDRLYRHIFSERNETSVAPGAAELARPIQMEARISL
jgi:hypothetical protein